MSTTISSSPLTDRVAVITGGARGIGLALATALAEAGASVALADVHSAASAASALRERGHEATSVLLDVTDPASVDAAFGEVAASLGVPDILVNSAGITSGTSALEVTAEEWNRVFAVNVTGSLLTSQAFVRHFTAGRSSEDREAAIVNVSSMSAFAVNVPQTQAAYNASKAAVSMMTKSTAIEWLPLGVRVNAIAPGYIASDMTRDFVADNPEMAEAWTARIPFGRMGTPEELGPLVVYLAGPGAKYVVGQSIVIDGGYTIV